MLLFFCILSVPVSFFVLSLLFFPLSILLSLQDTLFFVRVYSECPSIVSTPPSTLV